MLKKSLTIFILILSFLYSTDVEKGVELFKSKKFDDAYNILMPYAQKRDRVAQFYIGLIFDMGSIKFR